MREDEFLYYLGGVVGLLVGFGGVGGVLTSVVVYKFFKYDRYH